MVVEKVFGMHSIPCRRCAEKAEDRRAWPGLRATRNGGTWLTWRMLPSALQAAERAVCVPGNGAGAGEMLWCDASHPTLLSATVEHGWCGGCYHPPYRLVFSGRGDTMGGLFGEAFFEGAWSGGDDNDVYGDEL